MSFQLSPAALRFIQRMLRFSANPAFAFRLRVRPGGCAGLSTEFDIEEPATDSDELMEIAGVRLLVDFQSQGLLAGSVVDFSDSMASTGFVIKGPGNPQTTCGSVAPPQLIKISGLGRL
jgi:iron-sulfur cluster assembly accessory protein